MTSLAKIEFFLGLKTLFWGIKPSGFRSAIEALLRRVLRNQE
jgi:DNA/RNA-binding domain of Phe-tRNA-synthetase-like protein